MNEVAIAIFAAGILISQALMSLHNVKLSERITRLEMQGDHVSPPEKAVQEIVDETLEPGIYVPQYDEKGQKTGVYALSKEMLSDDRHPLDILFPDDVTQDDFSRNIK